MKSRPSVKLPTGENLSEFSSVEFYFLWFLPHGPDGGVQNNKKERKPNKKVKQRKKSLSVRF